MSKDMIKSLEKTDPIFSNDESLIFKGKVANLPVQIIFVFENNKLTSGSYKFLNNRVNTNVYIEDYLKITDFLDIRYGKTAYKKEIWYNDLYKEKKGYHGLAISIGQLKLISKWHDKNTTIIHILSGKNYSISHSIDYYQNFLTEDIGETVEIEELKGL